MMLLTHWRESRVFKTLYFFFCFGRRFLRETLKMSNAEDLNRLTACSLVLLGHIFYVLGNHRVSKPSLCLVLLCKCLTCDLPKKIRTPPEINLNSRTLVYWYPTESWQLIDLHNSAAAICTFNNTFKQSRTVWSLLLKCVFL